MGFKKISKVKRRWQWIDAALQHYDSPQIREFFSAAAKFLIPHEHWDDRHPETRFDADANIQAFHRGFESFSKSDMKATRKAKEKTSDLLPLLKSAADAKDNLRRRDAKSKLGDLRRRMHKRLKKYSRREKQPVRGLRFYEKTLKKNYLRKNT